MSRTLTLKKEVKQGDAIIEITIHTSSGKQKMEYGIRGYEGNIPHAHRSNPGKMFLEIMRARLGNIVNELPPGG